jgi:hypothetical protein
LVLVFEKLVLPIDEFVLANVVFVAAGVAEVVSMA